MEDMMVSLNSEHFDILKELGNIGTGNAIIALSRMVNGKINVKSPDIKLLEFQDAADILGSPEEVVFGILVNISGDINGMMMFLIKTDAAKALIKYLVGSLFEESEDFTEMDLSALQEIGNILSSSYLSALSTLTNKKVNPSIPFLSRDMAGAILSVPTIEFSKIADKVLFIESVFGTSDEEVSGYFILVPELESFKIILTSLGVE